MTSSAQLTGGGNNEAQENNGDLKRTRSQDSSVSSNSQLREKAFDALPYLPKAAFFMGDLRDGLPMERSCICTLVSV